MNPWRFLIFAEQMFDIDYIKLLNGNFKEISKNLKEGDEYVYRFSSGQLSDDFFAPSYHHIDNIILFISMGLKCSINNHGRINQEYV